MCYDSTILICCSLALTFAKICSQGRRGGPHPRREADPLYAGAPLHREVARDLPGREAPLSATRHLRFLIRILESLQNLVNPSIPKMEGLDACFQNCLKENVSQQYMIKTF